MNRTRPGKPETPHAGAHPVSAVGAGDRSRYRAILEELLTEIRSGAYKPGDRLPSEAVLCERFQASRITVAKAIQNLQRLDLVNRRAGSGTYIQSPPASHSLQFGLLIPEFGRTEIFEPTCQGMMASKLGKSHSLIWGSSYSADTDLEGAAEQLARQYVAQRVNGVFFAPLEHTPSHDAANLRILSRLRQGRLPVVLLDRCYERYPGRSDYDLVGIDNHRAGYVITRHLQNQGARRIAFASRQNSASTVDARIAGYYEALCGRSKYPGSVSNIDVANLADVRAFLEAEQPDAFVCANDLIAAGLMRTLVELGVSIPTQVRLVGIDDVHYAKFLPVPLTTVRQDCAEIGAAAMSLMLDRLDHPARPTRDVLIHFDLVVRESCGAPATRPVHDS